ncbi:MAG TPA: hypothetical protein PKN33_13850 [Phycisphaerae bacterium]|nr:hypothetical protein [Phycisphaerae bacterium]
MDELRQFSTASVQIWDWTQGLDVDVCNILESIDEDELTSRLIEDRRIRRLGFDLAFQIAAWRAKPWNANRRLTIMCGSGGALVATAAAEATCGGVPLLSGDVFHRVVFVSAAISTNHSLENLARITTDGIYNYYSYADATLQGYLCKGGDSFEYAWPAAGRFGYRSNSENASLVRAQFGWLPKYASDNNNGEHMNAYRLEFFRRYLRPVVLGDAIPGGWIERPAPPAAPNTIEPDYIDAIALSDGPIQPLSDLPSIKDSIDGDLVLIVPGHERSNNVSSLRRSIDDIDGMSAVVWDWTEADAIDSLDESERLDGEIVGRVAVGLASEVARWKAAHPDRRIHLFAHSGGVLVSVLACGLDVGASETARIPDGAFESIMFTSGVTSSGRSLDDVFRCSSGRVFNYYSSANDVLVGDEYRCDSDDDANLFERLNNELNATVENAVRWPAIGRFGNRSLDTFASDASARLLQLGWTTAYESYSNRGDHGDELGSQFAESFIVPIFTGAAPESLGWSKDLLDEYEDGDPGDDRTVIENVCDAFDSING